MIRTVLVVLALFLAGIAAADQVVVVRRFKTAAESPFSGEVRVVTRVDGDRVREESVSQMQPMFDSTGTRNGTPMAPDSTTGVWFPAERMWRVWGSQPGSLQEIRGVELDSSLAEAAGGSMGGLDELFGGVPESMTQDIDVRVDSTGGLETIAGVEARRYRLIATARYHELEKNVGDSLRFVREAWIAPAIPGAAAYRTGPSRMMELVFSGMQFLGMPIFKDAIRQLEQRKLLLPGVILREELRLESARPDSSAGVSLSHNEVLEIRSEKSRPELFRVPPGVHAPVPKKETFIIEKPKSGRGR